MTKMAFYFDPLCPWAWLTSLWARELQAGGDVEIEWKFFSLAVVNELDADRNGALRVCAQARREGGNEAVGLAYLALGRMQHERRERYETFDELRDYGHKALEEVGLDPQIVDRALDDETTADEVLREHQEAVEKYDAFGVPWIVLDDGTKGFFGPVIGERLHGEQARALWQNFLFLSSQPYLYELKRGRAQLPKLQHLSDEFLEKAPVAGSSQ